MKKVSTTHYIYVGICVRYVKSVVYNKTTTFLVFLPTSLGNYEENEYVRTYIYKFEAMFKLVYDFGNSWKLSTDVIECGNGEEWTT